MARLLILLTLPPEVREQYRSRLAQRFPQLAIDMVDHYSKAGPFMAKADALLTFGPHMKDEVLAGRRQAQVGAGARHRGRQSDRSAVAAADVVITNIRGIHGAPVSEAALMMMLGLARDFATSCATRTGRPGHAGRRNCSMARRSAFTGWGRSPRAWRRGARRSG